MTPAGGFQKQAAHHYRAVYRGGGAVSNVLALDEARKPQKAGIARSGESARQHSWCDELLKTSIRGKDEQMLKFADLETLPEAPHLHVSGHLDSGERVVVSFGPEHAALK